MLVVLADTHGTDDLRLEGCAREALREADLVVHAGDFTTAAVLDGFEQEADGLRAVYGNNDQPAVRRRLPATRVLRWRGFRIAVAHGHEHTDTTLPLFGKQSMADCVVVGHSHQPGFERIADVPILNPGSHAQPRRYRAAYAELSVEEGRVVGQLVTPDGDVFDRFEILKSRNATGGEAEGGGV